MINFSFTEVKLGPSMPLYYIEPLRDMKLLSYKIKKQNKELFLQL